MWLAHIVILVVCSLGVVVLFKTEGWTAFTSLHFQGPENLLPFLGASFTSILSGFYIFFNKWMSRRLKLVEQGASLDG